MNAKSSNSVQDHLLGIAIKKKSSIILFLKNKARLIGSVVGYDTFTILLETERGQILVFKHAVTSMNLAAHRN